MTATRQLDGIPVALARGSLLAITTIGIIDILNVPLFFGMTYHRGQVLAAVFALTGIYVFLTQSAGSNPKTRVPWYDWLAIALLIVCNGYVIVWFSELKDLYEYATPERIVLGSIGLLLAFEMVRRTVGLILIFIVALFIIYARFSNYFPDIMYARPVSSERLVTYLFFDPSGLYNVPLGVIAGVVLAFVLFGNFLFESGGGRFLTDTSLRLVGRYRGGPAKMSIVSSSLFGTMTGSAAANVAFTGMVTIPLMKKVGYRPAFAGAVEAVASSGGLLAPPVMGAAAFLMAEFTNITYNEIAIAAIGPALLYYIAVFIQVHLVAHRDNLSSMPASELPVLEDVWRGAILFFVPLAVLLYFLFWVYLTPSLSVMYATGSLIAVMIVLRPRAITLTLFVRVFEKTATDLIAPMTIAALAGLILGVVSLTGLGSTLSQALILFAASNLSVLLVFTALASIILGMGMPAVAIYILLAILVAPALTDFGVNTLAAHMFIYYFGLMSYVTPPMAFACFISGPMAGADPFPTGLEAMKLSVVAYIVPFLFVLHPELLLIGHWFDVALAMATAMVGAACIAAAVAGYMIRHLNWLERLAFVLVALALMASEIYSDLAGLAAIVALWLWLSRTRTRGPVPAASGQSPPGPG